MTAGRHAKRMKEAGSLTESEGLDGAHGRRGAKPFPDQRRSRSAEQSFAMELNRLRSLSVEELALEALGMPERFSWIPPSSKAR